MQLLIQQSAAERCRALQSVPPWKRAPGYEAKCRPAAPHLSFPAVVGRPCSGLRRSWPGVRRCYAANNLAGIQGSNLTTTRTSPHVVNTRNRPRHFSADADAESPETTPSSSRLHHAHRRPPTPTTCPCAGTAGLSSQLPAPCPSLFSMRAVSRSIPPPQGKRVQACWYLNLCSLPDWILTQGCKALHRQTDML